MYLEGLPEEILIIIVKKLDLSAVFNLCDASSYIRNIITSFKIIKTLNLCLTTKNSVQVLQSNILKDLSLSLQELNVAGMPNLSKSVLLQVTKRLKNLKTLNVSYTNINILDFLQIYQCCPTIRNLCINFNFGKTVKVPKNILMQCRELFKKFDCLYFVGNGANILYSTLPLYILGYAKLKTLQYTVIDSDNIIYEAPMSVQGIVWFDYLQVCLPTYTPTAIFGNFMTEFRLFNHIDFNNYEFVIVIKPKVDSGIVYTSRCFEEFFNKNFNCKVICTTKPFIRVYSNVSVMLWLKTSTTFDVSFFNKLYENIKVYFHDFISNKKVETLPLRYNRCVISPTQEDLENVCNVESHVGNFKKKRIGSPYYLLDYDEIFKDKKEVELSFLLYDICLSVNISANFEYLRKITYLYLCGGLKYSIEFFNILFRCCERLVTICIAAPANYPIVASVASSIPLSHTIKNLHLRDRTMDYPRLFSSLSQCKSLENVNLFDTSSNSVVISDPAAIFENCTNLYCFYVYAHQSEKVRAKQLQLLNNVKKVCQKEYLKVNIFDNRPVVYDIYTDVFKLYALTPIVFQ